jgi:hypothetical protein
MGEHAKILHLPETGVAKQWLFCWSKADSPSDYLLHLCT